MNVVFFNTQAFVLVFLVPVLIGFLVWRRRVYPVSLRRLGEANLIQQLAAPISGRRFFWRGFLWLTALIALIVALARPTWGINTDVLEVQGASVVVVLDVSNSMAAQDLLPSRLERAKLALYDLFNGTRGHEVALVLFAGNSFVQFPLTTDTQSALTFLSRVDTRMITQQGTVIEDALQMAIQMFDPQRPSARIVILATDGEDHDGDVERAVAAAIQNEVTIHVIGYGDSEGAPVPVLNDDGEVVTYKVDSAGQLVLSRLDEPTLQQIAQQTGGLYQRASATSAEAATLIRIVNRAETSLLNSRIEARSIERFGIFTLIAFITLTCELMLSNSQKVSMQ